MGVATFIFEIINLETQQKIPTSAYFWENKRRKGYFFTDFFTIRLYIPKSKHIYKYLKNAWYMVKKKNIPCCAFNDKIVATVLLASLTVFLWFT